jgi:EAL domain-containing protein (putative c-di-GMP-specific phosphodiesterase class I)
MKRAGIKISIDDFGTGYSSLSMIRKFKADVIKLDKSFVDETSGGDESSQLFMKDIICMIKDQDEVVLCEGVETKKQLEFLKEAGCSVIQGFYFDKPLPAEEFEERLAKPKYTKE